MGLSLQHVISTAGSACFSTNQWLNQTNRGLAYAVIYSSNTMLNAHTHLSTRPLIAYDCKITKLPVSQSTDEGSSTERSVLFSLS